MPVLISEIVFKGQIADTPAPKAAPEKPQDIDRKALIEACVEAVMRVIERREER
jgi:Family of unknown function (DUF5908)